MLGYVYGQNQCMDRTGMEDITCLKLTANQDLGVKVAAQVGTLFGQLFFGWLADILGRKKMCECETRSSSKSIYTNYQCLDGIELLIIIIATFGQAIAGYALAVNIFGVLIAWRFVVSLSFFPFNYRATHRCLHPRWGSE